MILYLDLLGHSRTGSQEPVRATGLMDMVLREGLDVNLFVEVYFKGKYSFGSDA